MYNLEFCNHNPVIYLAVDSLDRKRKLRVSHKKKLFFGCGDHSNTEGISVLVLAQYERTSYRYMQFPTSTCYLLLLHEIC